MISALLVSLKSLGCTVLERSGLNKRFAVIDKKLIWYGNMNLLGYSKPEENAMRFENEEIARELLDML